MGVQVSGKCNHPLRPDRGAETRPLYSRSITTIALASIFLHPSQSPDLLAFKG
ncbi:hypothetical protein AAZX31_14G132700 [Glycine max]